MDAVVSLCRLADDDKRDDIPHADVRLIDRPESDENPHLDFVLLDTVRAVEQCRREGRTVLVDCVGAAGHRQWVRCTGLRGVSADEALRDVIAVLPDARPNYAFRKALRRLVDHA